MNLTNLKTIKSLCHQYDLWPKKSKGQNFLISKIVLNKILKAADLKKDDIVLEVGPGLGVLTVELAKRVKKVIAVESDKKLFKILQTKFAGIKNLELVNQDILKFQVMGSLPRQYRVKAGKFHEYKIVANLPYSITSAFLRKFLSRESKSKEMIILVQKEVAERICAKPGQMSLFSVSVQFYGQSKIVANVSKKNFWPQPKVNSAIIKIVANSKSQMANRKLIEGDFFRIVRIGFSSRRKQLHNNLAAGLRIDNQKVKEVLQGLGISPEVRAQELGVEDWVRLTKRLG